MGELLTAVCGMADMETRYLAQCHFNWFMDTTVIVQPWEGRSGV